MPISADRSLVEAIGEIQGKAGVLMGLYRDWRDQHLPGLPLAIMVAPAGDYVDVNGQLHRGVDMDLRERLVFLGKCHDSMAGAGAMTSAAASRVRGTVAHRALASQARATTTLRIGHPLGVMPVRVEVARDAVPPQLHFDTLSLPRTARRLMQGEVLVPVDAVG